MKVYDDSRPTVCERIWYAGSAVTEAVACIAVAVMLVGLAATIVRFAVEPDAFRPACCSTACPCTEAAKCSP